MDGPRNLSTASTLGLMIGLVFLVFGLLGDPAYFTAHGRMLLLGFLLPALYGLHAVTLDRLAHSPVDPRRAGLAGVLSVVGAFLYAVAALGYDGLGPLEPAMARGLGLLGFLVTLIGAGLWSMAVMAALPSQSLVTDDPLTKGDDACLKHIRFSHVILPIALAFLIGPTATWGQYSVWGPELRLAGTHLLLAGYGLLSLYGIGHFWVPRFSGVPAIAAGAIKGELHMTLLGLVGLVAGFLLGAGEGIGRGLVLGIGGPFVFLGFFVYMGVLGANIMKNKSATQRVTPVYSYIPWTFAGIAWLICGVLMGLFLNVVPDALAARFGDLRFLHLHFALAGGMLQLWLGWQQRIAADRAGRDPPAFTASKWAFYAFNFGLLVVMGARFMDDGATWFRAGFALTVVGLALYAMTIRPYLMEAPA